MFARIVRPAFIALSCLASVAAAPLAEKTWCFTTDHTLTLDFALAAGAQPDWSASTVTLTPVSGAGAAQTRPLGLPSAANPALAGTQRFVLDNLEVAPWSPTSPALYRVAIDLADRAGQHQRIEQRVGFRSFTTEGGRLLLNHRPIFLRGLAINPPNRGIPEKLERSRGFAEDYIRYLLSLHVNIIRIPDDPTWYDVCDELGMMVFGGNYSGRIDGQGPTIDPAAAARWFREEKFFPFVAHPSLVIYALTNETPYSGPAAQRWESLLGDVHRNLHAWDPTRLYIANAGYGYGRVGEINDLHRYWGWYYQTPFTFLHLRDTLLFPEKTQPLTFTECVGNYNGPDGRVNLTPNHKNPLAQLAWTGHAASNEQGALEYEHQSFTIRQATELFRRLRPINSELSGVFPFTILFNHWHDITSFADMDPKPAALQLRASYQPILLSWELYTPHVYAGAELKPIAHVVNDADDGAALHGATLIWELRDSANRNVATGRVALADVAYFGTARVPLTLTVPTTAATGDYVLWGAIVRNGATVSENRTELFVGDTAYVRAGPAPAGAVRLYDPAGKTAQAFEKLGLAFSPISAPTTATDGAPVVIGEDAARTLAPDAARAWADVAAHGGRLVVLRQHAADAAALAPLLPTTIRMPSTDIDDSTYPPPPRPARNSFNVNPERHDHPVFSGITRRQLHVWSDYTGWDEQKSGLPQIYPVTDGFVLTRKPDIASIAVLANYGPGLEGNALAEFFTGSGSVIFCAFDLAGRAGLDPVADRLLRNLVAYAGARDGHERYPLIDAPIIWGQYETEKGILTGINSGLMLNSRPSLTGSYRDIPVTVTKTGHEFAGGPAGWNTRPGIAYVPFGRRPFGPYIHRSWSGIPAPVAENGTTAGARAPDAEDLETPAEVGGEGEGHFWCRVPAGRTRAIHRVFNPSTETLTVHARANGHEASAQLAPGETGVVTVPLAADATSVESLIRGDRRLVLLETAFE